MTYTQQLEQLLEEILNQFDNDATGAGWAHEDDAGGWFEVNSELWDLLDHANDLLYSVDDEDYIEDGSQE
jgi:hypothetical protein